MGQLVTLEQLKDMEPWYFGDSYYGRDARRYVFCWPNESFPHCVAIHSSDMSKDIKLKVEIRRWIERNLSETVILSSLDKSYREYYDDERTWRHSYEVSNLWITFHFEDEHSASMFKLRFSEHIKEITDLHPDHKGSYEKTSYYKED